MIAETSLQSLVVTTHVLRGSSYSTGMPASRISLAVPPEARSLTFCFWRPLARSRRPVLSYTDRIAANRLSTHDTHCKKKGPTNLLRRHYDSIRYPGFAEGNEKRLDELLTTETFYKSRLLDFSRQHAPPEKIEHHFTASEEASCVNTAKQRRCLGILSPLGCHLPMPRDPMKQHSSWMLSLV